MAPLRKMLPVKMVTTLRGKIILSFLLVIIINGICAMLVGMLLIENGIIREAQSKVNLDLNAAEQVYATELNRVKCVMSFTALRQYAVAKAIKTNDYALLQESIRTARVCGGIDFLSITDPYGRVIFRSANPGTAGDSRAHDPLIRRVMRNKTGCASTVIIPGNALFRESPALQQQARITSVATPRSRTNGETVNDSGMVLQAAVPILAENDSIAGIVYGGILLNRNNALVDTIKNIVYRDVQYRKKSIGTATIFRGDLRIATNVLNPDGSRAIGTCVSQEVYNKVIGQGRNWTERAFVVNDWYLAAYRPITDITGKVIGMLYVGMLEKKYTDLKRLTILVFTSVIVIGVVLSIFSAGFLSQRIVGPIRELQEGMRNLTKGDFSNKISLHRKDEIGSLARSFKWVQEELRKTYDTLKGEIQTADKNLARAYEELKDKQNQLVQAERMASMGQLSAGVAHELNNPLGTILLYSHLLKKQLSEKDTRQEDIDMIVRESMRCKNIIRDLLNFSRQSHVYKTPTDVQNIVEEAITICSSHLEEKDISFETHWRYTTKRPHLDGAQIKQMLINLLSNAVDAIEHKGTVTIGIYQPCANNLRLEISDTGCGIEPEHLSHVFTPFFTTKQPGKGTGLGLAIAYGIVKMHSGDIFIESSPGQGTTVIIKLPLGPARSEQCVT